jgi:hypothetical protein
MNSKENSLTSYFYSLKKLNDSTDPRHANNCVEMGLDMINLISEVKSIVNHSLTSVLVYILTSMHI